MRALSLSHITHHLKAASEQAKPVTAALPMHPTSTLISELFLPTNSCSCFHFRQRVTQPQMTLGQEDIAAPSTKASLALSGDTVCPGAERVQQHPACPGSYRHLW